MSDQTPGSGPKKELSMEARLLIAFGLMGVVLLLTPYIVPKPPAPPKKAPVAKVEQAAKPAPDEAKPAASAAKPPAGAVNAAREQEFTVETDLYKVTFTNRGALVKSWVLKKYKDSRGRPLELVNQAAQAAKINSPFAIRYRDGKGAHDLNAALFAARQSEDGLGIEFEYSNGSAYASKKFQFTRDGYLTRIQSRVLEGNTEKPHLLSWRGGFGDETVIGAAVSQAAVLYDQDKQELLSKPGNDVDGGVMIQRGNYTFAGLSDTYFAAAALPESGAQMEVHFLNDKLPNAIDQKEDLFAGVALGGEGSNSFQLFVGPKDLDLLKSISPRLEQLVDWGWFGFIAKPLFLALNWMNDKFIHNYGWSIVVLTVIINFLLLPLKITSLKSMKKMSVLQPQIKAINAKYSGMSLKDPRKAKQNEEIMDLYKKHGVNPASGCAPMLLQIPFFIAFYKVLSVAIEMRGATWLWVTDLSRPEDLGIRILPLAMVGTQFFLQKMTPNASGDAQQQRIMLMMPLFLGFMFYGQSSGLVLYWLTSNVVGIAQQWFFNRMGHSQTPAASAVVNVKKK